MGPRLRGDDGAYAGMTAVHAPPSAEHQVHIAAVQIVAQAQTNTGARTKDEATKGTASNTTLMPSAGRHAPALSACNEATSVNSETSAHSPPNKRAAVGA